MFRRYPYWGWLLVSFFLWCINGFDFHLHQLAMQPGNLAHAVNKDLRNRESQFQNLIKEQSLLRRMFADSITEKESRRINDLPFFIFGYDNDTLKFWNTNTIIAGYDSASNGTTILRNEQGVFVERSLK